MEDFYQVLGIDRSATQVEIRKAYKRLAQKHHPDKDGGDHTRMQVIQEAYEVLSDLDARARYDCGDWSGPDTKDDAARGKLMQAMQEAIRSGSVAGIIGRMRNGISNGIKACERDRQKVAESVLAAEKALSAVEYTGVGLNLWEQVASNLIEQSAERTRALSIEHDALTRALEILEDYEDKMTAPTFTATATTTKSGIFGGRWYSF